MFAGKEIKQVPVFETFVFCGDHLMVYALENRLNCYDYKPKCRTIVCFSKSVQLNEVDAHEALFCSLTSYCCMLSDMNLFYGDNPLKNVFLLPLINLP